MATEGTYYDGQSAKAATVDVSVLGSGLQFSGPHTPLQIWSIEGLHAIDPPAPGQPYRLSHQDYPARRLIIRDVYLINRLLAQSPHLKGGYSGRDITHLLGWTLGGLAFCAGLAYLAMIVLPAPIARILPQDWRERTGQAMEVSMAGYGKHCTSASGEHAIGAMLATLAEGTPDMPPVSVHVYDIPIVNAFALNGGRIIVTNKLIELAETPEEVAGVVAHEIGHVAHRHPEIQSVRLAGMEVLSSLVTGTNGGNIGSNAALMAGLMNQTREAEGQADAYAQDMLDHAAVDPEGLRQFFKKVMKLEGGGGKNSNAALSSLGSIFASHPGTQQRIDEIKPLPQGVVAKPAMGDADWKALKTICG
jgi:Zn-dependent protease with chaperone function